MKAKTLFLFALVVIGQSLNLYSEVPDPQPPLGSGDSEGQPYLITTLANLYWIADETRKGNSFNDKYFLQENDIDAAETETWFNGKGWLPFGEWEDSPFSGNYDGGGHTISNLLINRPGEEDVSLFGYVEDATIRNLHLVGAYIVGVDFVGGITGEVVNSEISNCLVAGEILGIWSVGGISGFAESTQISNSSVAGQIHGIEIVGGIAGGMLNGTITASYNEADIDIYSDFFDNTLFGGFKEGDPDLGMVGGMVGVLFSGSVNNSYNVGDIVGLNFVGGIAGRYLDGGLKNGSPTVIQNSFSAGIIKLTDMPEPPPDVKDMFRPNIFNNRIDKQLFEMRVPINGSYVGGVIGFFDGIPDTSISNCFFDKEAANLVDPVLDEDHFDGVTGKTTPEMKDINTFSDWSMSPRPDIPVGYPFLAWEINDSGSKSSVWLIGTGDPAAVPLSNTAPYLIMALIAGFVLFRIYRIS